MNLIEAEYYLDRGETIVIKGSVFKFRKVAGQIQRSGKHNTKPVKGWIDYNFSDMANNGWELYFG